VKNCNKGWSSIDGKWKMKERKEDEMCNERETSENAISYNCYLFFG